MTKDEEIYDDLVVGTGIAGLTVGALLAKAGRRVPLLEAHEFPGGYARTFPMGDCRFCAQVHYVFGCGEEVLEVATSCDYAHFKTLRATDRRAYNREKTKVRNAMLDVLEASYVPNLRSKLAIRVAGTPTTNEHFWRAPEGNSYGAALTPAHTRWPRVDFETPIPNLFLVNATAGYPSLGATVASGIRLHDRLILGTS